MADIRCINYDLVDVYGTPDGTNYRGTLAWGDQVEVLEQTVDYVKITYTWFEELKDGSRQPHTGPGYIVPAKNSGVTTGQLVIDPAQSKVLRVDFVDVQQGDGSVIQTPKGKVILVDGGSNQLFARYLAGRFRGTSLEHPKEIDCIVITHGDADHFSGLTEIHKSETYPTPGMEYKHLFIYPHRVYVNGLIKRPTTVNGKKLKESELFGTTVKQGKLTIITDLAPDITQVDDAQMNAPFKEWKHALLTYKQRYEQTLGPIEFRRLEKGDNDAFDFLNDENITVEVLGPIPYDKNGVHGLRFLGTPPKGAYLGHESFNMGSDYSGTDSSHTINGHSIVFRLSYGNLRFLYTGDLNDQAEDILVNEHQNDLLTLTADILKAPHHGSHEFSPDFLKAAAPVISIVSSGDESARVEYIHPRATLMGSLGRYSRTPEPLIFVTELVAFFNVEGFMRPEYHQVDANDALVLENNQPVLNNKAEKRGRFFAFSRTAFGTVRVRTDGKRLLIYTDSGKRGLFEAYAYALHPTDDPKPSLPKRV